MIAIIVYNRIGGVGVMLAEYYIHNILMRCIVVVYDGFIWCNICLKTYGILLFIEKIFAILFCNYVNMLYICVRKNERKEAAITHYIILFLFYVNSKSVLLNVGIKKEP